MLFAETETRAEVQRTVILEPIQSTGPQARTKNGASLTIIHYGMCRGGVQSGYRNPNKLRAQTMEGFQF